MAKRETGIAKTPEPPYVAVIFTTLRSPEAMGDDYAAMADLMDRLAAKQSGYLGIESTGDGTNHGITVSYWVDEAAAVAWKNAARHLGAQKLGRQRWYDAYHVRVCTVTRAYGFERD